jgi:integrase
MKPVKPFKEKIGKCTIKIHHGSYRIYLSLNNKPYNITVGRVCETVINKARELCCKINSDIYDGKFDLNNYKINNNIQQLNIKSNLKDIWQFYKQTKKNIITETTQLRDWVSVDNLLNRLNKKQLDINNLDNFADACLEFYSVGTLTSLFKKLNPAINLYFNTKGIDYINKQLPKLPKKKILWFNVKEVKAIINEFYNKDNYYKYYVHFAALTGLRPEEITALTWNDITPNNTIIINKTYTGGIKRNTTKNNIIREFKITESLSKLLKVIPKIKNKDNLIFVDKQGDYINHKRFHSNHWKPIIDKLVDNGTLKNYLRFYCLRHSYATNLIRNGVDIATVAGLLGDNIQTVLNYYVGSSHESEIMPNIYN